MDVSLDDIIAQNKKSKGGRQVGGFRSAGGRNDSARPRGGGRGNGGGGSRSTHVPDGRWKHDMFGKGPASGGGGRKEVARIGAGGNPRVRVLLSNLAATVNTADLEELFNPYNIESVNVHFNEQGEPVGTGDLSLRRKDAIQMLQDLKGLAIDEQVVKMTLVDETSSVTVGTIRDRIKLNRPKVEVAVAVVDQLEMDARHMTCTMTEWNDQGDEPRSGGGRRGGRGGGRRGDGGKKPLTEDELNAQLEAYMTKGKDDDMA
ncbi:unnamed protein product, partial [Mesorhabditis belari]|uniref:Chromatin target of PRMT1 protein C-terminal domain-containing protein n=1 Tax=Mesorhabditis belari TaxID=2138241 RepID=A0AAF3ETJ3_9BILA